MAKIKIPGKLKDMARNLKDEENSKGNGENAIKSLRDEIRQPENVKKHPLADRKMSGSKT
ncbi:MAG: hypothetical protein IJQ85_06890 [Selenomonadaceae bacterium]|nr:hypothetical protein [Selenomonadaceae bacterium]